MYRLHVSLCWLFYRARITDISGQNATVVFVDYGNSDTVLKSQLKTLNKEYLSKAPLAYECRLDKFTVCDDSDTAKLNELSEEGSKTFLVEFASGSTPFKVNLFDAGDAETNLVAQLPSCGKQPSAADVVGQ